MTSSKKFFAILAAFAAFAAHAAVPDVARSTDRIAHCSWDAPGHNPFVGPLPAALDRYTDIPPDVRARLQQRMHKRDYDDLVDIRRDSIAGKRQYDPAIRDMHFGRQSVCKTVSRDGWRDDARERGLVYCESGHCILVPTVCRNVSRIALADDPHDGEPRAITALPTDELVFDPPGAGSADGGPFESPGGVPAVALALPALGSPGDAGINPPWGPDYQPPSSLEPWPGKRPDDPGPSGTVPNTPAVPEPGTGLMALLGLAAVLRVQRRAGGPN